MDGKKKINGLLSAFMMLLSVAFLTPIFIVFMNSFKGKLFISDTPFALPNAKTFAGLQNYIGGITKTNK
jgi:raffinose/stachyose/melibiose transport system permease protein